MRVLWMMILGFLPAVAGAQMLGSSLISTSAGGVVSGTYGYFKYVSATYGLGGSSASKLASLTDVDVSGKVSGSVLVYSAGTTSWTALPIQQVMSTTTMTAGFPDAIICSNSGGGISYLYPGGTDSGVTYYMVPYNGGDYGGLGFNADGSYSSGSEWGDHSFANCHVSIASLYAAGRAFNFIGNATGGSSGSGDNITSGTTNITAINNTKTISITTNNVVTGYFNSNGVLTVPGISTTANLTSVTTLYASGRVGVGTSSPSATLHAYISAGTAGSTEVARFENIARSISIYSTGDGTGGGDPAVGFGKSTSADYAFYSSGGHAAANRLMTIQDSGRVGIGTSAPSYLLHVNGSVAGVGAYNALSDRRFKKDIHPAGYGLATVERMRPVTFDWISPTSPQMRGRQLGLIAQEVQPLVPEAVSVANDPSHTLSIAYGTLVPVLIKAVQELKADNDNLRATFEAYKNSHP